MRDSSLPCSVIDSESLLKKLDHMERLVLSSKWKRFMHHPFRYLSGMFFREIIYRVFRKEMITGADLFFAKRIKILLPSCMDLYLLGCKSHDAEIRLTRFIIQHLDRGDQFLDIGAHVGFYSLLAAVLTDNNGKIVCAEPTSGIYQLLSYNVAGIESIRSVNAAVLDREGKSEFFEFPAIHSEYNTVNVSQYSDQKWFKSTKPTKKIVSSITGDALIRQFQIVPRIIKVDVEGSENRVIKGLKKFLMESNPYLVMEFLSDKRHNSSHIEADELLRSMGYSASRITHEGKLVILDRPAKDHVDHSGLESDNIVYSKSNTHNII